MDPKLRRIEGRGNGGNVLELTEESEADVVANYTPKEVTYAGGSGPIDVKVIDPLNVKAGDYAYRQSYLMVIHKQILPNWIVLGGI